MASRAGAYRPGRFLPRDPRAEAPYRLTPQIVFRIGILGFLVLAAFAVLFFRLWALQVLSGNQFLQAAENNQLRLLRQEAPRGPIKDRFGAILVDNKSGTAVRVWPADLPKHGAYQELRRLAHILKVPLADVTREIDKRRNDPVTPVTVKQFAGEHEIRYLYEHQTEFPGVQIANTYVRQYRQGDLAAQLMGYVGEISEEQLKQLRGYALGDKIGQGGIEASFDKVLRGQTGLNQLRVDSLGRPTSPVEVKERPNGGYAVRLTLDAKLQRAAQQAVIDGINLAQGNHNWYATAGAIVALDPRDGSVRALASYPTYDPSIFTTRKKSQLAPVIGLPPTAAKEADFPALNRAIAGTYPPGSTFKPVTALAAMQEHILSPYDTKPCTGSLIIDGHKFNNWDPNANQAMNLPTAIAQSCDTYFYQVGKAFYDLPENRGQPLQKWATTFGFGQPTGLDVGPEEAGLVPTIKWRQDTYTKKTDPTNWQVDRLWKSGDSVQLAIGQKDIQVTPLQMARFYALVANGGKLVTPHLVAAVEQAGAGSGPSAQSLVLRSFHPPVKELNLDPGALAALRAGLYDATHSAFGTSSSVFGHFPVPIAGKTGTAEKVVNGQLTDTSWWCGYGPVESASLVVCAVIENGGFGGEAAAPAALQVFESYFGKEAVEFSTASTD
ncbi:MAG: penicillin-binding protein 2 [Actinomycetota bacterium]